MISSAVKRWWVKPTHPFDFEINNKMVKRSYNFNKSLSLDTILIHLKKKWDFNSFFDNMPAYINKPSVKLEENTLKKYRKTLTHLKQFRKQLFLSDVDNTFPKDFYKFLQTTLSLQEAACKKYMEALKKVIRQARNESYMDPAQMEFLFDDVKISVKKTKRTFQDIPEIKQWRTVKIPEGKEYLGRDRDILLFQIYTGYYYKDLSIFTKD